VALNKHETACILAANQESVGAVERALDRTIEGFQKCESKLWNAEKEDSANSVKAWSGVKVWAGGQEIQCGHTKKWKEDYATERKGTRYFSNGDQNQKAPFHADVPGYSELVRAGRPMHTGLMAQQVRENNGDLHANYIAATAKVQAKHIDNWDTPPLMSVLTGFGVGFSVIFYNRFTQEATRHIATEAGMSFCFLASEHHRYKNIYIHSYIYIYIYVYIYTHLICIPQTPLQW
jgi:hypothetical protein